MSTTQVLRTQVEKGSLWIQLGYNLNDDELMHEIVDLSHLPESKVVTPSGLGPIGDLSGHIINQLPFSISVITVVMSKSDVINKTTFTLFILDIGRQSEMWTHTLILIKLFIDLNLTPSITLPHPNTFQSPIYIKTMYISALLSHSGGLPRPQWGMQTVSKLSMA